MIGRIVSNGQPIYQATITPAHEGFIVHVEERIPQPPSMNMNEFKEEIGDMMHSIQEATEHSEINAIIRKNGIRPPQDRFRPEQILGPHVFVDYNEMIAFLSIVYEYNIQAMEKRKNKDTSK
jgi:FKBP-type peptidyl-prolyl cis-trans isomerase 2